MSWRSASSTACTGRAVNPFSATVRTASIALTEDQPPEAVFAALVHAAYDLARFDGFTQVPLRPGPRSPVQRELGPEVEAPFGSTTARHGMTGGPSPRITCGTSTSTLRSSVGCSCSGIANELEDHLDLASAHRDIAFKDRIRDQARPSSDWPGH